MKIAILSRNAKLYSTHRLVEAATQRGHYVRVIDYLRCCIALTSHRPTILYSGEPLEPFDAILPRIAATHTAYGNAVVRQFEMMKVFTPNSSSAIALSRDKLRCLQVLASKGIGLPVTSFGHSLKDISHLIEAVGGAPLVLKVLEGTQGVGVVLAESENTAKSILEAFKGQKVPILVQEFIREAKGVDIRCLVVGSKVVAAMKRECAPGEFRSNLHRGGTATKMKLTPEERLCAVRAAKAMGLRVAGVDILRSHHGAVVMEVNSSPGLEGIEKATVIDVANYIIELVEKSLIAPTSTFDKWQVLTNSALSHV